MIEGAVLDIDGTVARGRTVLPGALEALTALDQRGVRYAFFTNDNQKPVRAWVERLASMGIDARCDQIVTSALVAAEAVAELHPDEPVLAVGNTGLIEALEAKGLALVPWDEADRARVIVMGKDPAFDQSRLATVCRLIWSGARFVATNDDPRVPTADGFTPGTGPMVRAVAYATGIEPLVTGKPSPWAGRMAARILHVPADRTVVVGDQLTTDIAMGKAAGMRTVLVLTGSSTRHDAETAPPDRTPDAVCESIAELPELLVTWGVAAT